MTLKIWVGYFVMTAALLAQRPAAFDNSLINGAATISTWVPPVYPAGALNEKLGGRTVIRIIVDERGAITAARVLKADDPRLGEAALVAVKTWKFSAAVENENRVESCLDVPLVFVAAKGAKSWSAFHMTAMSNQPQPASIMGAEPKHTPPGGYPAVMVERKLTGTVRFACKVDATGRVSGPRILGSSHADFVLPALDALKHWEFTAAKQGDLAVATELAGEVSFDQIAGNRGRCWRPTAPRRLMARRHGRVRSC